MCRRRRGIKQARGVYDVTRQRRDFLHVLRKNSCLQQKSHKQRFADKS